MRGQNKKQKELESTLKVGLKVSTRGGAVGKIVKLTERYAEIELAPGVHVTFRRDAIEGVEGDPKPPEKKDEKPEKKDEKSEKSEKKDEKDSKDDDKSKKASKG
jgi:preprotein translocase subunit YajC